MHFKWNKSGEDRRARVVCAQRMTNFANHCSYKSSQQPRSIRFKLSEFVRITPSSLYNAAKANILSHALVYVEVDVQERLSHKDRIQVSSTCTVPGDIITLLVRVLGLAAKRKHDNDTYSQAQWQVDPAYHVTFRSQVTGDDFGFRRRAELGRIRARKQVYSQA